MERLTFEGNFCDISQCRELPCKYGGNCSQKQVWSRLKEYEDAGLSPQACAQSREIEEGLSDVDCSISRMVELMKADKDGRVLILFPIKFALIWFEEFGQTIFLTREEAEKALQEMDGKQNASMV